MQECKNTHKQAEVVESCQSIIHLVFWSSHRCFATDKNPTPNPYCPRYQLIIAPHIILEVAWITILQLLYLKLLHLIVQYITINITVLCYATNEVTVMYNNAMLPFLEGGKLYQILADPKLILFWDSTAKITKLLTWWTWSNNFLIFSNCEDLQLLYQCNIFLNMIMTLKKQQ